MAIWATTGESTAHDGIEAAAQAVEIARSKLGQSPVGVLIFASTAYAVQDVLAGANAKLRNVPLFGLSTQGQIGRRIGKGRSVIAVMLGGENLTMEAQAYPGFSDNPETVLNQLTTELLPPRRKPPKLVLAAVDGTTDASAATTETLSRSDGPVFGGLTGFMSVNRPGQIGGEAAVHGGISAAVLDGGMQIGIGVGHGWNPIGQMFEVTHAEGVWVRKLDGKPAAARYAAAFGRDANEWVYPPLSELIRMYPLGVEQANRTDLTLFSPLRVEADGSFRMGMPVVQGSTSHLMVGSVSACQNALRAACRQAIDRLGGAKPVLVLIMADVAWRMLFAGEEDRFTSTLSEFFGSDVPIAGGFTVGQLAGRNALYNQHVTILVIGNG